MFTISDSSGLDSFMSQDIFHEQETVNLVFFQIEDTKLKSLSVPGNDIFPKGNSNIDLYATGDADLTFARAKESILSVSLL